MNAVLRERPDVCLLDVRMPGGGIKAAQRVSEVAPSTSVVMLTVSTDTEDVLGALRAGAVGYLPKDTSPDRLPAALCGVLKGEAALPRALVGRVLQEFRSFTAGAIGGPVRVGSVQIDPKGVGDPQDARLRDDYRRRGGDVVTVADNGPPSRLRRGRKARCRRPECRTSRDRPLRRHRVDALREVAQMPRFKRARCVRRTPPPRRGCALPASRRCS